MTDARFSQSDNTFDMTCRVEIDIAAPREKVWRILTDADGFPRWNSTVTRIEGEIREGQRLRIHAPGTNMTFTPEVSGVAPPERMTWSNGVRLIFRGVRTFVLAPASSSESTNFSMEERFEGIVFALAKRALPDFGPIFTAFAADLKREAEASNGTV